MYTSRKLNTYRLTRRTKLFPQYNLRSILLLQNSNNLNRYLLAAIFQKTREIPSIPPFPRVLRSAHSQTRCFPVGSCQLILVSLVHLASLEGNDVLETILEPFVGLEDDMMER